MISQADAVKIAQGFIQTRLPTCPVRLGTPSARREAHGGGHRWRIMFDKVVPSDVVVSPEEVVVLVDEANGTPELELVV